MTLFHHRVRSLIHRRFREEFAGPLGLRVVDKVLPVVILNSRESYDEYCKARYGHKMPSQITGMYEYSRKRIVMYHDAWAPYEVIFHEGTHELVHHFTTAQNRDDLSYWFQEGLGTYFEGFRRMNGGIVLDPESNRNRLPAVRQAIKSGEFVPVSALLKMTIKSFWDWFDGHQDSDTRAKLAQLYYAESWALVHFMMHGEDGRYRQTFLRFFKLELKGHGTIEAFERSLQATTGQDLAEFQKKFIDYVQGLK